MNRYGDVTFSVHPETKQPLLARGAVIHPIMCSGLEKLIKKIRRSYLLRGNEKLHWHLELLIGENGETEEAIYPFPPELRITLSMVRCGHDSSLEVHRFPAPLKIDYQGDVCIYYHPYGQLDFTYSGVEESIINWIKYTHSLDMVS